MSLALAEVGAGVKGRVEERVWRGRDWSPQFPEEESKVGRGATQRSQVSRRSRPGQQVIEARSAGKL